MTDQPISKAQLFDRIAEAWTDFRLAFADLDEGTLTRPGAERWSVKDHVAHIAAWERVLLFRRLEGRPFAEAAGMDAETSEATKGMTAETGLNDYFFERDRQSPLATVLEASAAAHKALIAALEGAPAEQLLEPSMLAHVAGDTYEHYREHARIIRGMLARP